MKAKSYLAFLLAGALMFGGVSCKKDEEEDENNTPTPTVDTTPPTVSLERPRVDPETRNAGGHMHFRGTFNDNVELGEYKIDIHDVFDGHSHDKVSSYFAWSYEVTTPLSGKEEFVDIIINIPNDAMPGKYDLLLFVTDKAGNSLNVNGRNFIERQFFVSNADFDAEVVLDVTSPSDGDVFVHGASTITVTGNFSAPIEIEELEITIKDSNGNKVYDHDIHVHNETYSLNHSIPVPSSWSDGNYELEIEIELENGLHYHKEIDIVVGH